MNIPQLTIAIILTIVGFSNAEPESKREFPYQIRLLWDGGSFMIVDKSKNDKSATERVIDKRFNSKTAGEMYLGYPESKGSRIMATDEALKFIGEADSALLNYWGKDEYERLKKVASGPVPKDKDLASILPSMLHYDTVICISVFTTYRQKSKAQQAGSSNGG